ncbi:hypothetical protein ABEP18_01180 [Priestia megaterium]
MAKKKVKATKKKKKRKSLIELEISRTGGQIALMGYDYQLTYSCYKVLEFLDTDNKTVKLEGIEDIDMFTSTVDDGEVIEHTQLKHSKDKQDASFFDSILVNFLEVYMTDKKNTNRYFKLVYDMEIAKGNLSKLINNTLDENSIIFWKDKIEKIRTDNLHWDWSEFNFKEFYKQLKFEKLTKKQLESKIHHIIVRRFDINTGNEDLFINSLFYWIFNIAKDRNTVNLNHLKQIIQNTKDFISKGDQNPAVSWFQKINFDKLKETQSNSEYYEGKKATPSDIVNALPIRREKLEEEIGKSINENKITVIKSSSGQGKTTLAWQVAFNLSNQYSIYKLNWCKESKEIQHIVEYINSRLKLGEKVLIILDNLDVDLKEWNKLAQVLEEKVTLHYSLLITTREDDWYMFAGDQSNLAKLKVIDIHMNKEQAKKIYENLQTQNKLHKSITSWQNSWEMIQDKQILIEYVYLLTHGEMLAQRISSQVKNLNSNKEGKVKIELLRLICLADTMSIRLQSNKLLEYIVKNSDCEYDINESIRSIESEFFIKANINSKYIEGLHPIRSQHVVDILHSHIPVSLTLNKLLDIVDDLYTAKLFAHIPFYIEDEKEEFYYSTVQKHISKSYKFMVTALQGLFSGSILKFFKQNKLYFDEANERGGLQAFIFQVGPWNTDENIGSEFKVLEKMNEITPENENINFLLNLAHNLEEFVIEESDFYLYAYYLFNELKEKVIKRDISQYGTLASWLARLDKTFDIVSFLDLEDIWFKKNQWKFEELSLLMFEYHSINSHVYKQFIDKYKESILTYLKVKTDSVKIYEVDSDVYIEYLLLPQDYVKGNEESVKRINAICRFLPIYDNYIVNTIKPEITLLSAFPVIDQSSKNMPYQNVQLSFNTDITTLWRKSILSNYEFSSIFEWQKYWVRTRIKTVEFMKLNIQFLECILKKSKLPAEVQEIDQVKVELAQSLTKEQLFPKQMRPFDEPSILLEKVLKIKKGYFPAIRNLLFQFVDIAMKNHNNNATNRGLTNLKAAQSTLVEMQECFREICKYTFDYYDLSEIEKEEKLWMNRLVNMTDFYLEHSPKKGGYSRFSITKWKEEREEKNMQSLNHKLDQISKNCGYKFIKANKLYSKDNFLSLPIAFQGIDVSSIGNINKLIVDFQVFADSNIDDLILIFLDSQKKAAKTGIKVSTSYLKEIKKMAVNGAGGDFVNLLPPYSIGITHDQLNCFDEDIKFINYELKYSFNKIDIFLMLLWRYYQYKLYFSISNDQEKVFLTNKERELVVELNELLIEIQKGCISFFYLRLLKLKDNVIDGKTSFTNHELSIWVDEVINLKKN